MSAAPRRAVIDASVAIKWVVEETLSKQARMLRHTRLCAPDLLIAEVANVLWKKAMRGDVTPEHADTAARILQAVEIEWVDSRVLMPEALSLALALRHPAYDCFYLAAAIDRNMPFVTADARLVERVERAPSRPAGLDLISLAALRID